MLLDQVPEEFEVCACAADVDEARALAASVPNYVAVEPPELIGDISVTSADPGIVSGTVSAVIQTNDQVQVLCGAGVKSGKDVSTAMDLGAKGVLLASGVTKSENPFEALSELVSSSKEFL